MTIYRCNKEGYIETINTDGNYKPKGWSDTKEKAIKRGSK